ncbi:MAG: cupin domain-containing protein [Chloroflexi bacterium]|nr:cupin domain-containing protein [Chloroflexota bacterium]
MTSVERKELGDVGTEMLWENEHVRVWDLVLEPGQSSEWHRHGMHYTFIVTRPGRLKAEYEDGSESITDLHLGQVVMGQKGSVHKVTNVGTELYSNAIVEMKH